jgi:hypothetical protein
MILSMRASDRGQPGFDLLEDGVQVGWLRAGILGFRGFASQQQAARAGAVAADTLIRWYATRWYSMPLPWREDEPCTRPIRAEHTVIGRVLAPHEVEAGATTHAIELGIPHDAWSAVMLELAQRTYTALAAAGLVRGGVEPDPEAAAPPSGGTTRAGRAVVRG